MFAASVSTSVTDGIRRRSRHLFPVMGRPVPGAGVQPCGHGADLQANAGGHRRAES